MICNQLGYERAPKIPDLGMNCQEYIIAIRAELDTIAKKELSL
jgi:hypothetical protein